VCVCVCVCVCARKALGLLHPKSLALSFLTLHLKRLEAFAARRCELKRRCGCNGKVCVRVWRERAAEVRGCRCACVCVCAARVWD
jgi:hypothetical protein